MQKYHVYLICLYRKKPPDFRYFITLGHQEIWLSSEPPFHPFTVTLPKEVISREKQTNNAKSVTRAQPDSLSRGHGERSLLRNQQCLTDSRCQLQVTWSGQETVQMLIKTRANCSQHLQDNILNTDSKYKAPDVFQTSISCESFVSIQKGIGFCSFSIVVFPAILLKEFSGSCFWQGKQFT